MPVKIISKFEIKQLRPPIREEILEDMEWVCRSLGFLRERDKDKPVTKIFEVLLERTKDQEGATSDEIAELVGVTRGTVVHHLNKMIQCGIVLRRKKSYELRNNSLQMTIDEVEAIAKRVMG